MSINWSRFTDPCEEIEGFISGEFVRRIDEDEPRESADDLRDRSQWAEHKRKA